MNKHAKFHDRKSRIQHVPTTKTPVIREFSEGEAVFYHGEKYRSDLIKDGKPMKGYIYSYVDGTDNVYVVEFLEAKHSDYVMSSDFLSRARPEVKPNQYNVDVQPRRRKAEEDV